MARRPPMPGGGGMGRPLGPRGGRVPGGGGTGLPEGLSGGRGAWLRPGPGPERLALAAAGDCAARRSFGRWCGRRSRGRCRCGGALPELPPGRRPRPEPAGAAAVGAWAGREAAGAVDGAGADWAAGEDVAGGAAGGGVGRLLLIRRGERAGGSVAAGASAPDPPAAGADTGRAGAFLTGALLAAVLLETVVSGRRAGASPSAAPSSPSLGAADWAALVALAAFLAGAGSSGWTGRRRPSASALRRTRSACASSMEDEWLLTPIPRERASSSPSLLVRPSSLASS